jgi:hypothetical protein
MVIDLRGYTPEAIAEYFAEKERVWNAISKLLDEAERIAIEYYGPDDGYDHLIGSIETRYWNWKTKQPPQPEPEVTGYRKKKISHGLQKRVFERDAYRCKHCGTHLDLCVDHIIPESKGGTKKFDNLQTLCRACNSAKGDRL